MIQRYSLQLYSTSWTNSNTKGIHIPQDPIPWRQDDRHLYSDDEGPLIPTSPVAREQSTIRTYTEEDIVVPMIKPAITAVLQVERQSLMLRPVNFAGTNVKGFLLRTTLYIKRSPTEFPNDKSEVILLEGMQDMREPHVICNWITWMKPQYTAGQQNHGPDNHKAWIEKAQKLNMLWHRRQAVKANNKSVWPGISQCDYIELLTEGQNFASTTNTRSLWHI